MREWNAEAYHRVSSPQLRWGLAVLDRLRLVGQERVLDIGCGTGRLTEHLAWRVPRGGVIAVDASMNMLTMARSYLAPLAGNRVGLAQADATALPFRSAVDAVFSTATFHWVLDHDRLFRSIFTALAPGGRLVAQCGGGPNIERIVSRCRRVITQPPFATYFHDWTEPWLFADAATTARRLARAGFVAVDTSEHFAPERFESAAAFREFATNVVCRPYLSRLPPGTLHEQFMDVLVNEYERDEIRFELDYWRLNLAARKPLS